MANSFFSFRQFTIQQAECALKVSTDSCILGAWFANKTFTPEKILDIGSGSGLLMLMLAQKKEGSIKGIEIEPGCYQQSIANITNSPWKDRCSVVHGDVRVYPFLESFDFIISNPPFYENQLEAGERKKDMAKHSSHLGLSDLFKTVNTLMTTKGKFGVLLPYSRREESIKLAATFSLHCTEEVRIKQTHLHDFFRIILQFERNHSTDKEKTDIIIRENDGSYSKRFTELLKDFYLYL